MSLVWAAKGTAVDIALLSPGTAALQGRPGVERPKGSGAGEPRSQGTALPGDSPLRGQPSTSRCCPLGPRPSRAGLVSNDLKAAVLENRGPRGQPSQGTALSRGQATSSRCCPLGPRPSRAGLGVARPEGSGSGEPRSQGIDSLHAVSIVVAATVRPSKEDECQRHFTAYRLTSSARPRPSSAATFRPRPLDRRGERSVRRPPLQWRWSRSPAA